MNPNQSNTARAWRDADYFDSLTESEKKALSPNPAGAVKLHWRAVSSEWPDTHPASTCGSTLISDTCDTLISGCCSTLISDTCDTLISGCCG